MLCLFSLIRFFATEEVGKVHIVQLRLILICFYLTVLANRVAAYKVYKSVI